MIKVKAFVAVLLQFSKNPKQAKRLSHDKRLSFAEKSIIQAFFLLRDNKLSEVLKCLEMVKGKLDPVVQTQKDLLMGMALNNLSRHQEAISFIEKSINGIQLLAIPELGYFKFIALHNLFVIYLNKKDEKNLTRVFKQIKSYSPQTDRELILIMRCQFNYCTFLNKYAEAKAVLEEIHHYKDKMLESDIAAHLLNQFDFHIKLKKFTKAQDTLDEMKSYRKYQLTANYNFMKILLNHHQQKTPVHFDQRDFKDYPLLQSQIMTIKALAERDHATANCHWVNLQRLDPHTYQDDFSYQGDECLFSLCLNHHLKLMNKHSLIPITSAQGKLKHLKTILELAEIPVGKIELYQMIWGEEPDKEELKKLAKNIYRLRIQHGLNIKLKHGCYFIEKESLKKAS